MTECSSIVSLHPTTQKFKCAHGRHSPRSDAQSSWMSMIKANAVPSFLLDENK